jgi:hypothetical protein
MTMKSVRNLNTGDRLELRVIATINGLIRPTSAIDFATGSSEYTAKLSKTLRSQGSPLLELVKRTMIRVNGQEAQELELI